MQVRVSKSLSFSKDAQEMALIAVTWFYKAVLTAMLKEHGLKKDGTWRVVNNPAHFTPSRASIHKPMPTY